MNRGILIYTVVMLSFLFGARRNALSATQSSIVEGNTAFALDVYGRLKSTPGNLFFSPYSISTALAMTYAGARGDTEKQMAQALHFASNRSKFHSAFGELQSHLSQLSQRQGIQFNIANGLWAQKDYPFRPAFIHTSTNDYQGTVQPADFVKEAEATRSEINHWVRQQTRDKIQNILPPGSLTGLTRLVLANAIYFKGTWTSPFDKNETLTQSFHLSASRQVDVPLMHHFDSVGYTETEDFQSVELPYKSGELSMVILLPRLVDGSGGLEKQLSPAFLSSSLSRMRQKRVEIFLPRFKLESEFELNGALAQLGMPDAFGPKADFSGIDGRIFLYISGIFHKAWGEVNEEGTEAAAATTVAVAGYAVEKPPPPPPVFRADHPFIFFIRDTRSGALLFLGRLAVPSN